MSETEPSSQSSATPAAYLNTAVNIFTAPSEAFIELKHRPTVLFPLFIVLASTMSVMGWYFNIVDFDWFIDDTLAGANLEEDDLEAAREGMQAMPQAMFKGFGIVGGAINILIIYLVQSGYLSLVSALRGDDVRFRQWFSLSCWAGLPYLLTVIGMIVNIILTPNGQLSVYDLDPLTLANLGMQSSNGSVETIFNSISLSMVWSVTLAVIAYRLWLNCHLPRALTVVLAPYALIFGIWAYFALI